MARRLFLHIGAMKSGTTYLQGLFSQNRARLEDSGVRYVRASGAEVINIRAAGERVTSGKSMARRMRQAARGWDGDLLCSMELMAPRGSGFQGRLIKAAGADEVHIIVTGRDLCRVIPSRWQTTVQNRKAWTWPEYVQAVCSDDPDATAAGRTFWKQQDLARTLRNWSTVTEPRRMYVVTVPASSGDQQLLWRRFAEVLGVDPEGYKDPKPGRANLSLSMAAIEVLRRANPRVAGLTYPQYRNGVTNLTGRVFESKPPGEPRLQVPAAYRDWVEKRARRMNDEITELGVNVVGDLAELLPGPPDPHGVESVDVSDADLLDTALDGFAGTARILARARLERSVLRHRTAALESERDRLKAQLEEPWLKQGARRMARRGRRVARRIVRRRRASRRT